tara:strand:- start:16 stop:663 length:648 start_codon:yes stop_codon:yes gene_type:complete
MIDVSVIIPYHQDRGYLFDAIDSYEAQEFTGTSELILSHNPTFSQGQNINAGLETVNGKYVKILHDDDLLTPNCLQDLFDVAEREQADLVFSQALNLNEGVKTWTTGVGDAGLAAPTTTDFSFESLLNKNFIHGGTVLIRTEMMKAVGGYDESLSVAEEYDFHLKCLHYGCRIFYTPVVVTHYRMWPGSKSVQDRLTQKEAREKMVNEIKSRYYT